MTGVHSDCDRHGYGNGIWNGDSTESQLFFAWTGCYDSLRADRPVGEIQNCLDRKRGFHGVYLRETWCKETD